ncbi:MAG: nucleoside-diphosphate kinase [Firmicutes bacterium]|nr:nucleoside-diphosphate kinase [Bacillota bacterium]
MERTFVMIKPDSVQRGLVGRIISRFEDRGLKIVALKLIKIEAATAENLYAEHVGKPFYEPLLSYITSGPVVAMVLEGQGAVSLVRAMNGATNPKEAAPGTIRGDLGIAVDRNVIHASDSPGRAEIEMRIFFSENECVEYSRSIETWIYPKV